VCRKDTHFGPHCKNRAGSNLSANAKQRILPYKHIKIEGFGTLSMVSASHIGLNNVFLPIFATPKNSLEQIFRLTINTDSLL